MIRRTSIIRNAIVVILVAVLGYAGLAKINDPTPVSDFLVELISYRIDGIGRSVGFLEIALALWLISNAGRRYAAGVTAALFTSFAIMHLYASSTDVEATCGCFGKNSIFAAMPPWGWVTMNAVFAAAAVFVAVGKSSPHEKNACRPQSISPMDGELV